MDIRSAMNGSGFAKDAGTYNLAASIEQDGIFSLDPLSQFTEQSPGSPSDCNSRNFKMALGAVAGIFALAAILAAYLILT